MTASTPITADAAAKLLSRRMARQDFAAWCRVAGFEPARHHLLLTSKLMDVIHGRINRLIICMPPGSAKSTYSSVLFPPWFLSQRPASNILACSHSSDLATAFGRRARNLVLDHEKVLGFTLRKDSQAADEWSTTQGGFFFCAGVGGKIAGRRADLGLIDDPVGSKEDAYSKLIRDKTWDWFNTDFRTRLKPGASIVLIQTRWHEDDLAGRILANEGGEWELINLPMLAKANDPLGRPEGEMLWKDYFTPQQLKDAMRDPMVFSALYQQDPTPQDGDYFRRAWIENNSYGEGELPPLKELTIYCASDHAVSEKQEADSTCMLAAGVDADGTLWILPDAFWERCDSLTMVNTMIARMKRHKPRVWWGENEVILKSIGPFLNRAMRENGVYCYLEPVKPARDKQTRAQSIRGRLAAGAVRFPRFAPWYQNALDQLLKFPAGAHDDFVDTLAWLGLGLDSMLVGRKTPALLDESRFFAPRPITLSWVKKSHNRLERAKALALQDN